MTDNLPGYALTIGVGLAVLLLTYRVVVRIMTSHAHRVMKGLVAVLAAALGVFGAVFPCLLDACPDDEDVLDGLSRPMWRV